MVRVEVKPIRKYGLETWQIWVAGKYHTEFMNEEIANSTADRLAKTLRELSDEHTKPGSKVSKGN